MFYEELFACEARHYRTYLDLAGQALRSEWKSAQPRDVESAISLRLSMLAEAEGRIVRKLADRDSRATMHG